jgi:hypothetical protein
MRNNKPTIWVVRFVDECLTPIMDEDALTMLGLPPPKLTNCVLILANYLC